ncbi:amidohydrolase [Pseudonocardia sp. KRD-184]|uniref:Amidohydrolase n=1 Tax=Pseudonocardia oceani TaxID=2792013 RepID=A0ABS6U8V3_9PSEU|nr:M20 family metallopeptidase [Pseudonocardia oceani]MBW0092415.1 amidohydrolase [Pseudonocardia oceani]MBW0099370.1 amidohydrolase [Pseudonocardia oceani]MBW0110567.1 amidohydrolase [Pseudonocardia oceani]MBW0124646.1 amidohydrolase [Pseudonocardia oceani]MBW0128670.1 amidohydrolase [Pseudonocardia oceani]
MPDLSTQARALQPRTVALRRAIHRRPEVGLHLPHTRDAVLDALADLPLQVHLGVGVSSVVAVLDGARPGPTILLRGDMDALPMQEDTDLAFASEVPGAMHACGHDTHVAMLASAARLLAGRRGELAGRVLFMFQPGEEGFHGARYMIDEGLLDATGPAGRPERAYALHISATIPSGEVHVRPGPLMAAADTVRITVRGRGGHASAPHDAVDPVPAAAAMIGAMQTAITREVSAHDPAVLTIAHLTAGTTTNVIPETAFMEGTIRTLSAPVRERVREIVRRVCRYTALAHGCSADVVVEPGYPVTVNDDGAVTTLATLGREVLGRGRVVTMPTPILGAEDFSYVLEQVPGALAFLGACPAGVEPSVAPPNHSNRVVFDEAAMVSGVAVYAGLALDALR